MDIEKNKIDLKYQVISGLGLKSLGFSVSIPIGLAGLSLFRTRKQVLIELGLSLSIMLLILSTVFLFRSWKYLEELDDLKSLS
ncbi:MAG: hypothetical protein ABEJ56_04595 [Candidatus Nanohaloarchaea archaeon]